eukprot:10662758-Ditylum_brightwellii.AAC.1
MRMYIASHSLPNNKFIKNWTVRYHDDYIEDTAIPPEFKVMKTTVKWGGKENKIPVSITFLRKESICIYGNYCDYDQYYQEGSFHAKLSRFGLFPP